MFRRLVATSRAPQIMVLSMLRSFGKIGPQIDQIWAWLSRGHRWSPGVRNPLKSSVTGPSLLVNCYLEIKFHKIIRVNPPPPLNSDRQILRYSVLLGIHYKFNDDWWITFVPAMRLQKWRISLNREFLLICV